MGVVYRELTLCVSSFKRGGASTRGPVKKVFVPALLLLVSLVAVGSSPTDTLLSALRDLETSVREKGDSLRPNEVQDVLNLLREAKRAVDNGGSANPSACFVDAYRSLSESSSIRLCKKGGDASRVACFKEAYRHLPGEEAQIGF